MPKTMTIRGQQYILSPQGWVRDERPEGQTETEQKEEKRPQAPQKAKIKQGKGQRGRPKKKRVNSE